MNVRIKPTKDDEVLAEFEPVSVKVADDELHEISDVFQAMEWLLKRWPADHVSAAVYVQARKICVAAWEGKTHPEEARSAFLEAAQAAGICCERPDPAALSKTTFRDT
jgi:hypothetical protein